MELKSQVWSAGSFKALGKGSVTNSHNGIENTGNGNHMENNKGIGIGEGKSNTLGFKQHMDHALVGEEGF